MSLFKVFIENEVNLQTFEIWVGNYNPYLDDILELMLQNPNFIHNVKNLSLYTHIFHHNNNKPYTSIINHISQIINLHQNLKKIVLSYKSFLLYKPLLLSKVSNCSNTLNIIRFYHIDFKGMINFNEVFEQLNALESVHIVYCYSLDTHFIQQIINLTKPFKLKSLFINEGSRIDESLQLLLQKSGSYIENFGFGFGFGHSYTLSLKKKLIELIIKYCKNIKFLDICEVDNQIIYPMFNLIENIKENLNYLSIKTSEASQLCDSSSSIILQNLGQFLSLKLDYLNLTLIVNISDFKIFLEKSQNIFIKKLLIKNLMRKDSYVILPYIKEYNNIMKGKGIRYLAFMDNSNNNLFYSKDETKEFMLDDNIKVQKYDDLYISTFQFIRNLD
ncbi:hypothetical protein GLOIN_2v1886066 [Rhizophagus clarus]|nr:hypothetical protein GLOIN_2v1886066 [Rhizophagus clarus]